MFRWLFSWRGIRRILIVLAWSVTIVALWYGEENWRGRHAWNRYRKATEARGESLDFAAYIPKPVPDDQNFAATPLLRSFAQPHFEFLTNDFYARASKRAVEHNNWIDQKRRSFLDLVAWQMASEAVQRGELKGEKFETDKTDLAARAAIAPEILKEMKSDQPVFAELRAASSRKFSRYPLYYDLENPWGILLPHLARIKGVCERLNLQACAELAIGQSDQAMADVKLMLAMADSIKTEPFLISFLVRVACFQIAIHPVWEGLAEHRWNSAQLSELQGWFSSYDFLTDPREPFLAERAYGIQIAEVGKNSAQLLMDIADSPLFLLFRVLPSGWIDQEKLNYATLFDAQRKGEIEMDLNAKTISPHKVTSNSAELNSQIYGGRPRWFTLLDHRLFAAVLLPSLNNIAAKIAMAQTAANQAALGCALERYRIKKGQSPSTLQDLVPQFISRTPNDVITGEPYRYRRTDDDNFILYSVGWNEKDDGGVPGKTLFDQSRGDWVWSYPAK
jgi:hypothetical protein